jgi:hypothetical protein
VPFSKKEHPAWKIEAKRGSEERGGGERGGGGNLKFTVI